ncbi:member of triose phosphate translocator family [Scheffersomyces xylosifermentans]|uniref:member of triose phosphate translocator family n=1 Tax=Scheffersomyces xylosifermentans TaxID=1304137 RepID=UPI00315C51E0
MSANPSIENLSTLGRTHQLYQSSQINPNNSSTNLSNITSTKNSAPFYHPSPNNRINLANYNNIGRSSNVQFPLTPPLSKSSSPVRDGRGSYFFSKGDDYVHTNTHLQSSTKWYLAWLPPIDVKVLALCINWYIFSIISANSTKMILTNFKYPITLTEFQFSLNCIMCLFLLVALGIKPNLVPYFPKGVLPKDLSLRKFVIPTPLILGTTLPMGGFQFIGHITSHKATSIIPVSLVHTVKSLSPLITVLVYRVFFGANYKLITYITLIPLILGIMLTCYKKSSAATAGSFYVTGLVYAFISMLIFVSQNIFAKNRLTIEPEKILPTNAKSENEGKVDKLTILFYCSAIGFTATIPVYLFSEAFSNDQFSLGQLTTYTFSLIILNGISHFLQSLLAFQILGMISPINYSIANILKRIVIILISFFWESKNFSSLQNFGLALTIFGLYCYDRWGTR